MNAVRQKRVLLMDEYDTQTAPEWTENMPYKRLSWATSVYFCKEPNVAIQ